MPVDAWFLSALHFFKFNDARFFKLSADKWSHQTTNTLIKFWLTALLFLLNVYINLWSYGYFPKRFTVRLSVWSTDTDWQHESKHHSNLFVRTLFPSSWFQSSAMIHHYVHTPKDLGKRIIGYHTRMQPKPYFKLNGDISISSTLVHFDGMRL